MTRGVGAGLVLAMAVGCEEEWLAACFSSEQAALKQRLAAIKTPPAIRILFMTFKSTFEVDLSLLAAVRLGQPKESLVYTKCRRAHNLLSSAGALPAPATVCLSAGASRLNFFRRSAKMKRFPDQIKSLNTMPLEQRRIECRLI